jgi:hypothetical protein
MDSSRGVLSGTMDRFKMVCRLLDFLLLLLIVIADSTLLGFFLTHVFLPNTFHLMAV